MSILDNYNKIIQSDVVKEVSDATSVYEYIKDKKFELDLLSIEANKLNVLLEEKLVKVRLTEYNNLSEMKELSDELKSADRRKDFNKVKECILSRQKLRIEFEQLDKDIAEIDNQLKQIKEIISKLTDDIDIVNEIHRMHTFKERR